MKMNLKKKSRLYFNNFSYFIKNPFLTKIEKLSTGSVVVALLQPPYVIKKRGGLQAIKNSFLLQSLKTKTRQNYFFNRSFDKNKLKALISWSILSFGEKKTIDLVEKLKTVGYSYATKAGISLGIDDLKIPSAKKTYLREAQQILDFKSQEIKKGHLTSIEFFSQVIEIWNKTSEILKEEVIENFKKTDELNPVFLMAFSGARGNISQVRQLVGLRGLMSDVQGQIINYPILSNFREGLTLTEYVISCYGARKGVVDTALRTATSGYLTRRLVDVAQHVIVRSYNCGTKRGIYLSDLKKGQKTILSLKNRILGRRLAEDILDTQNELIGVKNQEITKPLAVLISKVKTTVLVRSPLTCLEDLAICQLCYGWSLSSLRLVPLGEAVGTIAAQSIGEPGTQLTMRTFHTGGVFSGEVSEEIKAPFRGIISFSKSISGKLTRTAYGQLAFLTKQEGFLLLTPEPDGSSSRSETVFEVEKNKQKGLPSLLTPAKQGQKKGVSYSGNLKIKSQLFIPAYSLLFVKQNQLVEKDQVLAEESSFLINPNQSVETYQTIYSEFSGEVRFQKSKRFQRIKTKMVVLEGLTKLTPNQQIDEKTFAEKKLERIENRRKTIFNRRGNSEMGEFWILSAQKQSFLKPINLLVQKGDFLHKNAIISLTKQNNDSTSLVINRVNFGTSQQSEPQKNFGNNFPSESSRFSNKASTAWSPPLFSDRFCISLSLFNEKFFFRKGFLFQKSDTLKGQNLPFPKERLKKGFRNNLQISGSLFHSRPYFILLSTPNLELLNVLKTKESFSLNSKNIVEKSSKPFFANTEQSSISSKDSLTSSFCDEVPKNGHQIGFLPLFKTKTGGFGIQEISANVFQSPVKASTLFLLSQTLYDTNKFLKVQENFTKEVLQDLKLKNLKFSYFYLLSSVVNHKKVFSKNKGPLFPTVVFSNSPLKIKKKTLQGDQTALQTEKFPPNLYVLPRRRVFVKKNLFGFYDLFNTKLNRNSQFFFADKQKLPNFVLQKSLNKNNIIIRPAAATFGSKLNIKASKLSFLFRLSFCNFRFSGPKPTFKRALPLKKTRVSFAKRFLKDGYNTTPLFFERAKVGFNKSFFEHLCGYPYLKRGRVKPILENFKLKSLFQKDILKLSYQGFLLSPPWLRLWRSKHNHSNNSNCQSRKPSRFFSPFAVTKARSKLFHFIFSLEKVKTKFRFIGKDIVTRRLFCLDSQTPIWEKSCSLKLLPLQKSLGSLQKSKSYVEKTSEGVDLPKDQFQPCLNNLQERQNNPLFPISLRQIIEKQATNEVDINTSWEYLVPKRSINIWFQQNQKVLKSLQLADLRLNLSVKKKDNKKQKSFFCRTFPIGKPKAPYTKKVVSLRGNFQLESKVEFEGWSLLQTPPFDFLAYQNQMSSTKNFVTTTCKAKTPALTFSNGKAKGQFCEVKEPSDLKVSPFSKRNKKKISLAKQFQNDFNPGLQKFSLSRVFLLNTNPKQSFFSSKSLLKFWDTAQLYAVPNMFLNDKDKKVALFTFYFTKKVKYLPNLGSLLSHPLDFRFSCFARKSQTEEGQRSFLPRFCSPRAEGSKVSKRKKTFSSTPKESRKKINLQGIKNKSSQIRIIKKSEILFSIFHYQIFQKCCNASLSVFFKSEPLINKANLGVFQYKSNLLNKIPIFDSLINSARFFNLSLKAKQIFLKNLYKDLETSYKIQVRPLVKKSGLTLNPIFSTIEQQNTRNLLFQPSPKLFELEQKKYKFLNKKEFLRSRFYNSFSDQKFYSDYGFVIIQSKTQVKKFQKPPFAITKGKSLPFVVGVVAKQLFLSEKQKPQPQSSYQRSSAFSSQNFRLSFIIPGKKNVYQSSNLASFTNQIRSRVFKNFQQTFLIKNTNVLKENRFCFFPTWLFVPKFSQIKLDLKRKKGFGFGCGKGTTTTTASKVFLNSFKNQYFITKWFSQIAVENKNNLTPIWDSYLLNYSQIDLKLIQQILQKKTFHFFVISNLLPSQKTRKTRPSFQFLLTDLFNQNTFTPSPSRFVSNKQFEDGNLGSLFKENQSFLTKTDAYLEEVVQVKNQKDFHSKKTLIRKNVNSGAYLLTNYPGWIFSIINPTLFLHKHNCINSPGNWVVNDISFDNSITLTRFVPIRFQNRFFQLQGKIDLWQNTLKTFSFNKLTKTYSGYKKNIFEQNFNIIKKELFYLKFANKKPKSKKSFILHPSFISKYQVEENLKLSNSYAVEDLYLKFLANFDKERNILKLSKTLFNFYPSAFSLLQKQKFEKKTKNPHDKHQSRGISPASVVLLKTQGEIRQEKTKKRDKKIRETKSLLKMTKFFSSLSQSKISEAKKDFLFKKVFILKSYLLFPFSRLNLLAEEISWSSGFSDRKSEQKILLRAYENLSAPFSNPRVCPETKKFHKINGLFHKWNPIFVQNKQTINNYCRLNNFKTLQLPLFSERFNSYLSASSPIFLSGKAKSRGSSNSFSFGSPCYPKKVTRAITAASSLEKVNSSLNIFNILSLGSLEDFQRFSYSHHTKTDLSSIPAIYQNQNLIEDKTLRFDQPFRVGKSPSTLRRKVRLPFLNNSAFTFNLNARFKPQLSISEGFVLKESSCSFMQCNVFDFKRENERLRRKPAFRLASVVVQQLDREKKGPNFCEFAGVDCYRQGSFKLKGQPFSKKILDKRKVNKNQRKVDRNKKFLDSFEKMAGVLAKRKIFYLVSNSTQTLLFTQKSNQYFSKTSKNYKNQISNLLTKANQVKKRNLKQLVFSLTLLRKKGSKKKFLSQLYLPTIKSLMLKKFLLRKQLVLSKNSYNKKATTQLTYCNFTYLSLIQNKQKISKFIDVKTNSMPEIYWTFFESNISKQKENFFPQYKETELPESTFTFNNSNGKSPLRLVKLKNKTTQEKKRISKISILNSDFKNNKTIVKVTQDNKKIILKKNIGLRSTPFVLRSTKVNESFAEVRELKINTVDDRISSQCETPKKISYFFRVYNVISKDLVDNSNIWKTFSFSYFINKRNKKKKEKKSFRNKKSAFQTSIKIFKPLFNPFQKQDDLFFSLRTSNSVSPNLTAQIFFTEAYACSATERKGLKRTFYRPLNLSKNQFLLTSPRERDLGLFRKNLKPLSSKLLEQHKPFRFFSKIGLTKRYSFVLTKFFSLNFITKAAVPLIPLQQGKRNKAKGQNKVKQGFFQKASSEKAKTVSHKSLLLSNKDKNFNLKPNFESFTKRFLTLTGNLIPFKKVSCHFPLVETKSSKRNNNSKAKPFLQKLQNKVFKNIYTIDFNSYFFLKDYSKDFYLFSGSVLKRGVFNNRLKPLFNFIEFQNVPNISSFETKINLTSSSEKLLDKPILNQAFPLKNVEITSEKTTTGSQNFKNVFHSIQEQQTGRPVNKYKFFQHNKAIYLFQLHLVISSLLNPKTISLYNEKPLKLELFETACKTTSQTFLYNQNKKVESTQLTKTENKWNGFDSDQSRLKGEIVFASPSTPFKMVDFKFFKKAFYEIQFLTHLDLITFALEKSFILKNAPSTNSLDFSKKSAQLPKGIKKTYLNGILPKTVLATNTSDLPQPFHRKKVNSKIYLGQFVRYGQEISFGVGLNQPGQILILKPKKVVLRYAKPFLLSSGAICDLVEKDFININAPLFNLKYKSLKTEDIVQGIPKIEQLFEARGNLFNETGVPYLLEEKFQLYKKEYPIAEAVRKSIEFIQNYIIDGIQKVYQSQGVNISDKHIEIIVKQMTLKVRIVEPNRSGCLEGDLVDLVAIERMNNRMGSLKAVYEPLVLGITKASLEIESFISAASFQETIKVLTKATIFQRCDFLRGLKENVILGNLLPTGTGEKWIRNHWIRNQALGKPGKSFLTFKSAVTSKKKVLSKKKVSQIKLK